VIKVDKDALKIVMLSVVSTLLVFVGVSINLCTEGSWGIIFYIIAGSILTEIYNRVIEIKKR